MLLNLKYQQNSAKYTINYSSLSKTEEIKIPTVKPKVIFKKKKKNQSFNKELDKVSNRSYASIYHIFCLCRRAQSSKVEGTGWRHLSVKIYAILFIKRAL